MIQRAAVGIVALAVAGFATVAQAKPEMFMAKLTADQSVAVNSTPLETRKGTGMGMVIYDQDTGDFQFMLSFEGLIDRDITPPGSMPTTGTVVPGMPSGANVNGFGVSVSHIHRGTPFANGSIPFPFSDRDMMDGRNGLPNGVVASPNPIQSATRGMISGKFNLKDLAARNMGTLQAGVQLDGPGPSMTDPQCGRCGFNQAIATNNTYLNIHTSNNPFGEIRAQVIKMGCQLKEAAPIAQLVTELDSLVSGLAMRGSQVDALRAAVTGVRQAQTANNIQMVRAFLSELQGQTILNPSANRLTETDVDQVLCAASNVAAKLPIAGTQQ